MKPCYRVCLWNAREQRWRPYVTRTRSLFRTLRPLLRDGIPRADIHVDRRPSKLIPFPMPAPKGSQLRLVAG